MTIQQKRQNAINHANANLQNGQVNTQGGYYNGVVGRALEPAVKSYIFGNRGRVLAGKAGQVDMIFHSEYYEIMHNGSGYCMLDENGNRHGEKLKAKYFIYAIALPGVAENVEYYVENARVLTAEQFVNFAEEWGLFRTKDHKTRITMQSPDPRSAKKWGKVIDALKDYPSISEWFGL